jgi:ribonucleoside-diphosphate reductase alpha chain
MQLVTDRVLATPLTTPELKESLTAEEARYAQYKVIRRNGSVVGFEPSKISIAMTKAFIAVNGGQGAASARVREQVAALTQNAVAALMRRQPSGGTFHIEDIQDQVELALMRAGEHNVARAYVLYRDERSKERAREREAQGEAKRALPGACSRSTSSASPRWCARRARASGARSPRSPCSPRRGATSTTACRWRRCASR